MPFFVSGNYFFFRAVVHQLHIHMNELRNDTEEEGKASKKDKRADGMSVTLYINIFSIDFSVSTMKEKEMTNP